MVSMLDKGENTDDSKQDSMLGPSAPGQGKYSDGCMVCGQVKPIAAGNETDGYECMECWQQHGSRGPEQMSESVPEAGTIDR